MPGTAISTLVADGGTVMVEWHGGWTIGGRWIATTVMAVFEVVDGRIVQMREAYDLQSLLDQVQAAMGDITGVGHLLADESDAHE
jgi:limonene-1,2-epoxide hydrolase